MTQISDLDSAKRDLVNAGQSELELVHTNPAVEEYWQRRHQLIEEQNVQIAAAVQTVLAEHQHRIAQLDQEYSMYLRMIMPNQDGQ
jgi:hypothetical protein